MWFFTGISQQLTCSRMGLVLLFFTLYTLSSVACEMHFHSGSDEENKFSEGIMESTLISHFLLFRAQRLKDMYSVETQEEDCVSDSQCDNNKACWRGNCMNPCARENICSVNAICQTRYHLATCVCKPGTSGDGYMRCVQNTSNNSYQCKVHEDCPSALACVAQVCTDPCIGRCGNNTLCDVKDHTAACVCREGTLGNPLLGCTQKGPNQCNNHEDCPSALACLAQVCTDPCIGRCGNNTLCDVKDHTAACVCKEGYSGSPLLGCTQKDPNQCNNHEDCPTALACLAQVCSDPCIGRCGNNTLCDVKDHTAACVCKEGTSGNPLLGCTQKVGSGQWPPINAGEKKFTLINDQQMNWFQASDACFSKGMRLASIENEQEQITCNELLEGHKTVAWWIGGSDLAEEGKFSWIGGGLVGFSNYSAGQPDDWKSDEDCLELVKSLDYCYWNDLTCISNLDGCICEYY